MAQETTETKMAKEKPEVPRSEDAFPPQTVGLYLNLSVLWLAFSLLWAGMITIVIQKRVEQMAGPQKDLYLGWTLALGALISTLVCLVMGTISDRSRRAIGKRRPYILGGVLLSVPALLLLPLANTIPLLILDFCLIQLTVNAATAPYQALMPDTVPKGRQGTASAYLGLAGLIGTMGGLLLCGVFILRPGGLWTIVVTLALFLAAAMGWTLWRIPEHSAVGNPAPQEGVWATLVDSFRVKPRENPDFFWLIGSRFLINMGFYTATEFLLYYVGGTLHDPNPEQTFTKLALVFTVSGLLGNFPAGILCDRVSKKLVVYASAAITATAALVFVLTNSLAVAFGAGILFGAGFGAFQAVDWAFATNLLPDHDQAKHMGVWHVAFTVPQVIAPFIGGPVAYYFNTHVAPGFGYRAVLFLVIVYFVTGTLLIRPIRERRIARPADGQ